MKNSFIEKYVTYDNGAGVINDNAIRISPSQINTFITKPHQWFRETIFKEEGFVMSTSSVIGTIVHGLAESVVTGDNVKREEIEDYINSLRHDPIAIENGVDPDEILNQYEIMASTLINDYVLQNKPTEVENFVFTDLGDDVVVGGTYDGLVYNTKDDAMIIDYKTYNSKSKPKTIPSHYKYQLLTYAFILNNNGYNVNRIRLVYVNRNIDGGVSEKTGKPLKSYPPEVTVLTEEINNEDLEFISGIIELIKDSITAWRNHPELTHVIWKDIRLKG